MGARLAVRKLVIAFETALLLTGWAAAVNGIDVIDRVPKLCATAAHLKEEMTNAIIDNLHYAYEHGTDRPEIAGRTWPD